MSTARILIASTLFVLAACSSGDDAPADAVSAPAATTESTSAATTNGNSDPTAPAPTGAPDTTDAGQGAGLGDEATDEPDDGPNDVSSDDDGFVIDGPASVRPSCASLTPGVSEFELEAGGGVHDVRIFVPETVASDPAPTVLNWHGLGGSGAKQAESTGYEALASQEGFVVVHATGLDVGGANSWELAQFESPERDDLAFVDALIDTVVEDWCGDPARIYSTGMSNGGLFTSELVCHRSTRIAAAASVAGTTHVDECEPERAVPYVAFHGTADTVVPYSPDVDSVLLDRDTIRALIDEGIFSEFAEFATDAGCDLGPTRVEQTDVVNRYDYVGCTGGIPMTFYEIEGGGHTWPSSPSATTEGWAFMSQHSL